MADAKPKKNRTYRVFLDGPDQVLLTLQPEFLSLTIDISVLVGGRWWGKSKGLKEGLSRDRVLPLDLEHPKLIRYASALGPCMLRIGGTEADRIRYGFYHEAERWGSGSLEQPAELSVGQPGTGLQEAPRDQGEGEGQVILRKSRWKSLCRFAARCGLGLVFNIGMGPEHRDAQGRWNPRDAARMLSWAGRKDSPVRAWEFGNEVNAFPFIYGPRKGVGAASYARDFAVFARLVGELDPGALRVGPASAIWPLLGEVHPLIRKFCRRREAEALDVVSFHYYPQQSDRGSIAVRRASEQGLLKSRVLDEPITWIRKVRTASQHPGRRAPALWVTETGHALYGGQAGLSDTFNSSLWWLDQLCLMAHEGVQAVFRQSLVGSDYGLLDPVSFEPRPDWWICYVWKKLVGPGVHTQPLVSGPDRKLRVWHHGGRAGEDPEGSSWLVCVNLDRQHAARIELVPDVDNHQVALWGEAWVLQGSDGPLSASVNLNGRKMETDLLDDWGRRSCRKKYGIHRAFDGLLPPLACAFLQVLGSRQTPEP